MEWFGNKNPQLLKAGGTLYSSYFETIIIEQFLKVQHLFSIKNLILFCPKNEKIEKRYEFNFIFEL